MKHLRRIRKTKGLTQMDLARLALVDLGNISKYENGQVQPSLLNAHRIARALKIKVDELGVFDDDAR